MTLVSSSLEPLCYEDKIRGGWMGKNIGGTLGGPLEGRRELMDYSFYPKLAGLPLANDDLDLQLVWLHALETYGPRITARELAREWQDHVFFPFDEYGYALTNMRRGMEPPVSGWYSNPFTHCMGSPIRSEIWAMVAPGKPELAAYYAYQDAITDHAGGEGVYGEMFFAAIESAAFVESARETLIEIGLSVIPEHCRTAKAAQDTLKWHSEGLDWQENRRRIIAAHGRRNFTDAPQNIAFTILGWLYGEDFGDAICKAVNCGYDTDCTGATLGAILGILLGAGRLPQKWTQPLGEAIVVSPPVNGFPAPKDITELTDRTARVGAEVAAFWRTRSIPRPSALWTASPRENRYYIPVAADVNPSLEAVVRYDEDGPVIFPGQKRTIEVELTNRAVVRWYGRVQFHLPSGWLGAEDQDYFLEPGEQTRLTVTFRAGEEPRSHYQVDMEISRLHNQALWQSFRLPLVLAQAMRWRVQAPGGATKEITCPTNRIAFEAAFAELPSGVYVCSSHLMCPSARDARLMLATASPVRAWLDDQQIFDSWTVDNGLPAYHRGRGVPVHLPAGTHLIQIEVEKRNDHPFELYVACVAGRRVREPGPLFSYLDVMFL